MTLDDMLTLRLQIPQTDNMNYTDSFVQIVDTDNIEDFLQIYRYINIALLKIQGVSKFFKNGIKAVQTEDAIKYRNTSYLNSRQKRTHLVFLIIYCNNQSQVIWQSKAQMGQK
uniref:Eukaryotic initiation factor 4E-like protein n=1 Tax=Spironucleus salmonicida TaxID=348837 RepID=V6LKX1_9EUKA|eukprot:EST45013.1 Eukaryotic initiation factor 4E-like protein [Spironucleus salmonicida]